MKFNHSWYAGNFRDHLEERFATHKWISLGTICKKNLLRTSRLQWYAANFRKFRTICIFFLRTIKFQRHAANFRGPGRRSGMGTFIRNPVVRSKLSGPGSAFGMRIFIRNPAVRSKLSGPGSGLGMGIFIRNPKTYAAILVGSRVGARDGDFH